MWSFTNIENKQKLQEIGDARYIYCNELGKACFHHDMADDIADRHPCMPRRRTCDKVLRDKPFATASNPQNDGHHCGLASMVYRFFDNKFRDDTTHAGTGATLEASQRNSEDHQLANELHRTITREFSILIISREYLGWLSCRHQANEQTHQQSEIFAVLLISTANMHGLVS